VKHGVNNHRLAAR